MSAVEVEAILSRSQPFERRHRTPSIDAGAVLSLGEARGEGTFGEVVQANPADPHPGEAAIVAKVFDPDELTEKSSEDGLIERVARLQRALGRCTNPEWPLLLRSLPFAIVRARVGGEPRLVAFMLDLQAAGYETVDPYDPAERRRHLSRPAHELVELAFRYAQGVALLEEISFLHCDQNAKNLMFDYAGLDVQIIDLDSGIVIETGNERPQVAGKLDDCMPPEVKRTTAGLSPIDTGSYTAGAERWSVGSLVGLILFGIHPGFFLRANSAKTIDAYSRQGPWPDIDLESPEMTSDPQNRSAFVGMKTAFEAAPGDTRVTFARFFAAGTDGDSRPTAEDWVRALDAARQPPRFKFVVVDPPVVPEGTEALLTWATENADHVESPVLGQLPASGEAWLVADASSRHSLTAVNFYGRVEQASDVVRVVALPKIESIPLPGFPGLELKTTFSTATPPPRTLAPQLRPVRPPAALGRPLPRPPLTALPRLGALFTPPQTASRRDRVDE